MNTELKVDVVNFLTRGEANDRDRDAAKLVSGMQFDTRHVEGGKADVIINAEPDRVAEAKSSHLAGRIENAVRESSSVPVRQLQWVEHATGHSPRSAGEPETGPEVASPQYKNQGPNPSIPPKAGRGPGDAIKRKM